MRLLRTLTYISAPALMSAPALAEVPSVVTDIPAVHSLSAMVMGELGEPSLLLEAGADPHHYQMRPSQARALAKADLVVWMGPEMTPWLARALDTSDAAEIELLHLPKTRVLEYGEDGHKDHDDHAGHDDHDDHKDHADHDAHDHDKHADHDDHDDHGHEAHAEHGHDDHDHVRHAEHEGHDDHKEHADHDGHDDHADHDDHAGHDEHGHKHEGIDPHAWLSPDNALTWIDAIAAALAKADPENAAIYDSNAMGARRIVAEARDTALAQLDGAHTAPIVVFHDAYRYYSEAFDLNVVGAIRLGDAAAPGAGKLKELRDELKENGVVCVFAEAQHDPAQALTVIEGTGAKLAATKLDPSGTTLEFGPTLYPALLTNLASSISDCIKDAQ